MANDATPREIAARHVPAGAPQSGGAAGPCGTSPRGLGLPGKLLLLTIAFVMLAEVLVFVPSVSNFRLNWLAERLEAAQIAALAAEAAPGDELPTAIRDQLLISAQVRGVALKRDDTRRLILQSDMPAAIDGHYDLRTATWLELMADALAVYTARPDRHIRVIGEPSYEAGEFIEMVISEEPLRAAMVHFGLTVLALSIAISVITGALVYLALNALLVRPITALTRNMVRFSEYPEDGARVIVPSERGDEIGIAERELAQMQRQLAETLQQKSRLAALGLAVSKINHDLRNILATAQLVSDRLVTVKDPTVQLFTPKLVASIDRAIRLCAHTLKYGRAQEPQPQRARFALAPLAVEVGDSLGLTRDGDVTWDMEIAPGLEIDADRDQIYRVLENVCRNACEALEGQAEARLAMQAWREGAVAVIEVTDTGPGVPEKARAHLFQPFQGTGRSNGTGLGLAIAAELVRAHGGSIELLPLLDGGTGARFRIAVPDRVAEVRPRRTA